MKKNILYFICFIMMCATSNVAYGHGGSRHVSDMQRVFPFQNNDELNKLYWLVTDYLDKPNDKDTGKPQFINDDPVFSKLTFYNHRIWYHWGFNTNPKDFAPLSQECIQYFLDNNKISLADADRFWMMLENDIKRRNKELMNEVSRLLIGRSWSLANMSSALRKQTNGFVTILYSVHILGDHQGKEIHIISPLKSVYGDIYNALDNIAGNNINNRNKSKQLKNKLRLAQNDPQRFIDKLAVEFTPFVLSLEGGIYDYKSKFKKMGYKLKSE